MTAPTPHSKPAPAVADYTRIVDDLTYHYDGVFDRNTVQRASSTPPT
jgi:hypothetical protein